MKRLSSQSFRVRDATLQSAQIDAIASMEIRREALSLCKMAGDRSTRHDTKLPLPAAPIDAFESFNAWFPARDGRDARHEIDGVKWKVPVNVQVSG
jgi:hypothetical protein